MIYDLREDGLSGIHPSLSVIAAARRQATAALGSTASNSNRKIVSYIYLSYYLCVIAGHNILAGH